MALLEKQGLPQALIGLAAHLPWWLGMALAMVSYWGLNTEAQKPLLAAIQPGQTGSFVFSAMAQALARAEQYLLPVFFGLGALMSAFRPGRAAASGSRESCGRH